jgi:hypothetical protein
MSKKFPMVLGYTRTGKSVLLPTRGAPDTSNAEGYRRAMSEYADWTPGDHVDTSRILREHGERERDRRVGTWCTRWGRVHRDAADGRSRGLSVRGGAEATIRPSAFQLSKRRR